MKEIVLQVPGEPAGTWYFLFNLYFGLGLLVGVVVVGMLLYFILKYRETVSSESDEIRPGVVPGERSNMKLIIVFFGLTTIILFTLASYNVIWIEPTEPGTYTIQCYELCGIGHSLMVATLRVV